MGRRATRILGYALAMVLGLVVGAYNTGNVFLIGQLGADDPAEEAEMIGLWVLASQPRS